MKIILQELKILNSSILIQKNEYEESIIFEYDFELEYRKLPTIPKCSRKKIVRVSFIVSRRWKSHFQCLKKNAG